MYSYDSQYCVLIHYLLSGATFINIHRFWNDVLILGFHLCIGAAIYLTIWYLLSKWFRKLVEDVLKRLKIYVRSINYCI